LRSLARLPRGITKVSGVCESSVLLAGSLGVVSKTLSNYSGSSVVSKLLFLRRKKNQETIFFLHFSIWVSSISIPTPVNPSCFARIKVVP